MKELYAFICTQSSIVEKNIVNQGLSSLLGQAVHISTLTWKIEQCHCKYAYLYRGMVNLAYGLLKVDYKHKVEFLWKEKLKKNIEISILALS